MEHQLLEASGRYLFVKPIADEDVDLRVLSEGCATSGASFVGYIEQAAGAEGMPACDGNRFIKHICHHKPTT